MRFLGGCANRQAKKINEARLSRIIQYGRSRHHPVRDETIVLFSVYGGLPAKEVGALKMGDVSDEAGAVPEQFNLSAEQSTGSKTRMTLCVPCL